MSRKGRSARMRRWAALWLAVWWAAVCPVESLAAETGSWGYGGLALEARSEGYGSLTLEAGSGGYDGLAAEAGGGGYGGLASDVEGDSGGSVAGLDGGYYDGLEEEWKALDRFLESEIHGAGADLSFSGLMEELSAGNGAGVGRWVVRSLANAVFQEIAHGSRLAGQLLALGMVGAVFTGFSDLFSGSQISETGFFITYLMAFCVMAASFFESMAIAADVLGKQLAFMQALIPSYFLAVAWSGASMASAAWYELVLFLIGAVQWLYWKLLLPLIRVYVLLAMAGHMAREDMLSRMTELLKTCVEWGSRSLIGIVLGFQLIQGMVLPYADAAKTAGVQKLLQVIPGVGQGAGAVGKLLLGSGVLIKNTMGAAAVVILLVLSLLPVVKLAVLVLLHRGVAAVIQPIADKRLVACISSVADGQKLLLVLVCSALCLFVIAIALICSGTNAAYLGV